jgi:hypothetical protein
MGTVIKTIECVRNGVVIGEYEFGVVTALGPTIPPDLIKAAKDALIDDGVIEPTSDFSGITFRPKWSR